MGTTLAVMFHPDVTPIGDSEPTFDPMYGFPDGRKERVMIATEQELIAAQIPKADRDYCAHHLLKLEQCRYYNMPWVIRCAPEKHAYEECYYDDYVLRMKEYERERRLRVRQKRKAEAAQASA